jgi:hypothetical protein
MSLRSLFGSACACGLFISLVCAATSLVMPMRARPRTVCELAYNLAKQAAGVNPRPPTKPSGAFAGHRLKFRTPVSMAVRPLC